MARETSDEKEEAMREQSVIVQSVDRAIGIINLFTGPVAELGITDIAGQMELSKSTVYGLVNTLAAAGYLEQNPESKRYRLGLKLFELGSLVRERMDLREIARPYLKELSVSFGMTVHMGLYRDWEMVYIDKVDAPNQRIIYSQVGKRAPMYCTGIGKAVLANLNDEDIQHILSTQPREALTRNTKTEASQIMEELAQVRQQGYAVDYEEVEIGLSCVAVPVFDDQKKPVAAISISSSAAVLEQEKIQEAAGYLKKAAGGISRRLGYYP